MRLSGARLLCVLAAVLLSADSVVSQFRFGCEDTCDKVWPCEEVECSNGRLAMNATKCGCCHLCMEYINENEPCDTKAAGYLLRRECGPQLTCDVKTSKCVPADRKCMRDQKRRQLENIPLMNTNATCDEFGFYEPVVCISNVLCYCVDKEGKRIFGTDIASKKDQMHCNCSRDFAIFPRTVPDGNFLRCLANGNYDILQCTEEWCYCIQDKHLGYGQSQNANESLENLACYDSSRHKGQDWRLMSKCWRERMEIKATLHEFQQQNITVIGIDLPECLLDGSYAPVQCKKNECYCVNEKGKKIDPYVVPRKSEDARSMDCNCARDKELIEKQTGKNANMELFLQNECLPNGNYRKI